MSPTVIKRLIGSPWCWLLLGSLLTFAIYSTGLSGAWLFDDYPNIVDNPGVRPASFDLPSLLNAALSSPSSDFKRPLASLSFAINFLITGMDPFAMKATNVVIHLLNGLMAFLLLRALLRQARDQFNADRTAALAATAWLLLSINLTSVLYTVQRMESMANFFVLLGLYAYVAGRTRMLAGRSGFGLSAGGILLCTGIGALAKETAVMLPLYAFLVEAVLFRWRQHNEAARQRIDRRLIAFFILVLAVPMVVGSAWLAPSILDPQTWARRDFTLGTRLLSEARIVVDYIGWTLVPTPRALSFYHDDFVISQGLLQPWTTLASILALAALSALAWRLRHSRPLVTLGIAWYLGCHLLTATVLPLELVYEHRNYFASLGLILAVTDLVAHALATARAGRALIATLVTALVAWQAGLTLLTARSWGDPLALASELAYRGPNSPRAQYELGRTYVIYSHYRADSPYADLARAPLERAAAIDGSSILPEQALIFMNSRMDRPIERAWWASMTRKLASRPPTVQDESSLDALSACLREASCHFPAQDLLDAYLAAMDHPKPSARLLAMYANFAWSTLNDKPLALRVQKEAVAASPAETAYRIGLAKMATGTGDFAEANAQIESLAHMNMGGRLDRDIATLRSSAADGERKKAAATHE